MGMRTPADRTLAPSFLLAGLMGCVAAILSRVLSRLEPLKRTEGSKGPHEEEEEERHREKDNFACCVRHIMLREDIFRLQIHFTGPRTN